MIFAGIIILALAGLTIFYLRRPASKDLRVSAARFIGNLSPSPQRRQHWQPQRLLTSWRYWLRLTALLLLLSALFVDQLKAPSSIEKRIGVRLVIDTSFSMTAVANGQSRMEAVREVLGEISSHLIEIANDAEICVVVAAVDTEIRELGEREISQLPSMSLTPRPVGGSAALLNWAAMNSRSKCLTTHAVVVTDLPAPVLVDAKGSDGPASVLWLSVGEPADNIGIVSLRPVEPPLASKVRNVRMRISAFGAPPKEISIHVVDPNGRRRPVVAPDLSQPGPWPITLTTKYAGSYEIELSPKGAYRGDDHVRVDLSTLRTLQVDWRISEFQQPKLAGWQIGDSEPDIRILPIEQLRRPGENIRTLVVAGKYRETDDERIGLFAEESPLLRGVNFDVLERFAPTGVSDSLPEGFAPVVRSVDGAVWMAMRAKPRGAIVPAPELGGDTAKSNLSLLVFFNALRWILQDRVAELDVVWLTPEGTPIRMPHGEGDTFRELRSVGQISDLLPLERGSSSTPIWPWFIVAALFVFLIERIFELKGREATA